MADTATPEEVQPHARSPKGLLKARVESILKPIKTNQFADLEEAELRLLALEMRRDRYSITAISKAIGINMDTISIWIREKLDEVRKLQQMTAQQIIQLELEGLDKLQVSLEADILLGEPRAVEVALKISESRRKLLGLDSPDRSTMDLTIREYVGVTVDGPNADV